MKIEQIMEYIDDMIEKGVYVVEYEITAYTVYVKIVLPWGKKFHHQYSFLDEPTQENIDFAILQAKQRLADYEEFAYNRFTYVIEKMERFNERFK